MHGRRKMTLSAKNYKHDPLSARGFLKREAARNSEETIIVIVHPASVMVGVFTRSARPPT